MEQLEKTTWQLNNKSSAIAETTCRDTARTENSQVQHPPFCGQTWTPIQHKVAILCLKPLIKNRLDPFSHNTPTSYTNTKIDTLDYPQDKPNYHHGWLKTTVTVALFIKLAEYKK